MKLKSEARMPAAGARAEVEPSIGSGSTSHPSTTWAAAARGGAPAAAPSSSMGAAPSAASVGGAGTLKIRLKPFGGQRLPSSGGGAATTSSAGGSEGGSQDGRPAQKKAKR